MTTACEPAVSGCHCVGIDPSLTATGLCILVPGQPPRLSAVRTAREKFKSHFQRLDYIVAAIADAIGNPEEVFVCIEAPFMNPKMLNTVRTLMELNFHIRRKLFWGGVPFMEIAPSALKKFVTGKGSCPKDVVIKKVFQLWNIDTDDNNEADAAVLAYLASAVQAVREQRTDGWRDYQLDVVRKLLAKG